MELILVQEFCSLVTTNNLEHARKVFSRLSPNTAKLYIQIASVILQNRTHYPEHSVLIANRVIKLSEKVEIETINNTFNFKGIFDNIHKDLKKNSVKILKDLAERLGIPGFKNMKKTEVIAACRDKIIFKNKKGVMYTDREFSERIRKYINLNASISKLYTCDLLIGNGTHSFVFSGTSNKDKQVALKVEIQRGAGQLNLLMFEQSIIRNFKASDDRLIKNLDVFWNINYLDQNHPNWKINITVSPLYLESLDKALKKDISTEQKLHWAREAVRCIEQAHNIPISGGVIHRDIKPQNFCLQNNNKLVLIDFGLAEWAERSVKKKESVVIGSEPYNSSWSESYSPQSYRDDVQAVGFMIWKMLYGSLPWEENKKYFLKRDSTSLAPQYLKPYFTHCNRLNIGQRPDYKFLISTLN